MTKLSAAAEKDLKARLASLDGESLPDGVRINFGDPQPYQTYTDADAKAAADASATPLVGAVSFTETETADTTKGKPS